jgi:hypothetical protein
MAQGLGPIQIDMGFVDFFDRTGYIYACTGHSVCLLALLFDICVFSASVLNVIRKLEHTHTHTFMSLTHPTCIHQLIDQLDRSHVVTPRQE